MDTLAGQAEHIVELPPAQRLVVAMQPKLPPGVLFGSYVQSIEAVPYAHQLLNDVAAFPQHGGTWKGSIP
jgi:hypothetical protein